MSQQVILDAALRYAAAGIPVLALYSAQNYLCGCNDPKCKNPGKHPYSKYAPKGVYSATTDPDVIRSWEPPYNIGAALGGRWAVLDCDNSDIANDLCDPEFSLHEHTGIARSGRQGGGIHLWMEVTDAFQPFEVKLTDKTYVGSLRGAGQYVVLPPSQHYSGATYTWLSPLDPDTGLPPFEKTDDPVVYVRHILKAIEREMDEPDQTDIFLNEFGEPRDIIASPIPADLDALAPHELSNLQQLFRLDLRHEHDRSGKLWMVARRLAEVAKKVKYPLDETTVAGVIKAFDEQVYQKYIGRSDANKRYWLIAAKILQEVGTVPPDQKNPQIGQLNENQAIPAQAQATLLNGRDPIFSLGDSDYVWDTTKGSLKYYANGHNQRAAPIQICNFLPKLVEDIQLDNGDGESSIRRMFKLRFTKLDGLTQEFIIKEREFSDHNFAIAVARRCSSDFVIMPDKAKHIRPVAALANPNPVRIRVPAHTGWLKDAEEPTFLLPSLDGSITGRGINQAVKIDPQYLEDDAIVRTGDLIGYGKRVRIPDADELEPAWQAFWQLVTCAPPAVAMPIILHVLAGPLASSGVRDTPPLLHVFGKTGSLKTSYCLAALSLFGDFPTAVTSWSGTINSTEGILHAAKDLTVLVDDYKVANIKNPNDVIRLIQNYADGTARKRMASDQTLRVGLAPRGLLLSTGEDSWEDEGSVDARTIKIDVQKGDISSPQLYRVADDREAGVLQLFGGLYLHWLAQRPQILDGSYIRSHRKQWINILNEKLGTTEVHLRQPQMVGTLLAVSDVLTKFIQEVFPQHLDAWRALIPATAKALMEDMIKQSADIAAAAPWRQLSSALAEALTTGAVRLDPARGLSEDEQYLPSRGVNTRSVGFWYEENGVKYVLLTENLTLGWYKERRSAGRLPSNFSWKAIRQEAVNEHKAQVIDRKRVVFEGKVSQISGIVVKLTAIIGEPATLYTTNPVSV